MFVDGCIQRGNAATVLGTAVNTFHMVWISLAFAFSLVLGVDITSPYGDWISPVQMECENITSPDGDTSCSKSHIL